MTVLHEHDRCSRQANRLLFEVTCIEQDSVVRHVEPTMIDASSTQQCPACELMLDLKR